MFHILLSKIKYLRTQILLLILFLPVLSLAQENRTFVIYDATDVVDSKGRFLQIVDTDNGRPMSEMGISLDLLQGDVVVYVTFKRWGDLLLNRIMNNTNKEAVMSFFNFYDNNDGYRLFANYSNIYNTAAVRAIGERLKSRFPKEIAEWEKKDELFNVEDLAIIVRKSPMLEELFPLEWIEAFEPTNEVGDCPLYYTGKLKIQESEKKFVRKIDFDESSIQVGNELLFNETFNISGPSSKRMVVDRYVEICTFDEDYDKLNSRILSDTISSELRYLSSVRSKKLFDVLGHMNVNYKEKYRQNPYVFPGKKFERLLLRRMAWDVQRDTLETYRELTKKAFTQKDIAKEIYEIAIDTVNYRIDYNLFNRYLSKYKSFWAISPMFEKFLPKDGGETYEDSAAIKKYYYLRTDVYAYDKLREYMERGRRLKGTSQHIVEGFVPPIYTVRSISSTYCEFWLSNTYYNKVREVEDYNNLVNSGAVSFIRKENNGNRLRIQNAYKGEFRRICDNISTKDNIEDLFLTEKALVDTTVLRWEMPDPNLYYRLKHVNYLHDFQNADTTETECSCSRAVPLRFLSLSAEPAMHDCPPLINGKYPENYRPKSKNDEPQSIEREAHLVFAQGDWTIDVSIETNARQLDSLRRAADEILGKTSNSVVSHRIDTIFILGISSPEGNYQANKELSHKRSESLVNWIKTNCGIRSVNTVYVDSVASWDDVGTLVKMNAESAQSAYSANNQDVKKAMENLRKVQLRFVYTALMEPSEDTVFKIYNEGGTGDIYGAYYYYTLLNSKRLSHEEKLKLAEEVVNHGSNKNFKNTRDVNRASSENWFDLIKPLAANYIALDKIKTKKFDRSILDPFIDINQQGNSVSYSLGHLVNDEVPKAYKYVNADFVLYNQIQMLIGIGNSSSLQSADSLLQILAVTNYSMEFEEKYKPSRLTDLIECYHKSSYLTDQSLAERVKGTNIINFYVISMAQGHDAFFNSGIYSDPIVSQNFTDCYNALPLLEELPDESSEKYYFKAVTLGRYADMSLSDNKPKMLLNAREALVELFMLNDSMIGICQGDRYLREIYRTPTLRQQGIDIYLEAVEEYINRWSKEHR